MISRLRLNDERLFVVYFKMSVNNLQVIEDFPHDYLKNNNISYEEVKKFICPFQPTLCEGAQFYTPVFTDIDGRFKFLFCHYIPSEKVFYGILSYYPYYSMFYGILTYLMKFQRLAGKAKLLTLLYDPNNNKSNHCIQLWIKKPVDELVKIVIPDILGLPLFDNTVNLIHGLNSVDEDKFTLLFMAAIFERRILIISSDLTKLSSLTHSIICCLAPLSWEHVFIPLLPESLVDYIGAPMPYIIGIYKENFTSYCPDLENVVVFDVDENILQYPTEYFEYDSKCFTEKHSRWFYAKLSCTSQPIALSQLFLRFFAKLLWHLQFCIPTEDQVEFDREKFISLAFKTNPENVKLLTVLIETQSFSYLVHSSLKTLVLKRYFTFDEYCDQVIKKFTSSPKASEAAKFVKKVKPDANPTAQSLGISAQTINIPGTLACQPQSDWKKDIADSRISKFFVSGLHNATNIKDRISNAGSKYLAMRSGKNKDLDSHEIDSDEGKKGPKTLKIEHPQLSGSSPTILVKDSKKDLKASTPVPPRERCGLVKSHTLPVQSEPPIRLKPPQKTTLISFEDLNISDEQKPAVPKRKSTITMSDLSRSSSSLSQSNNQVNRPTTRPNIGGKPHETESADVIRPPLEDIDEIKNRYEQFSGTFKAFQSGFGKPQAPKSRPFNKGGTFTKKKNETYSIFPQILKKTEHPISLGTPNQTPTLGNSKSLPYPDSLNNSEKNDDNEPQAFHGVKLKPKTTSNSGISKFY